MTSDLILTVRVQSSSVAEVENVGRLLNKHSRHMKEADLHRKCSVLLSEGHCGPGVPSPPFALLTHADINIYECAPCLIVQIQSGKLLQSAAEAENMNGPFYTLCFLCRQIFKLICLV